MKLYTYESLKRCSRGRFLCKGYVLAKHIDMARAMALKALDIDPENETGDYVTIKEELDCLESFPLYGRVYQARIKFEPKTPRMLPDDLSEATSDQIYKKLVEES
jgi:hypothetical protein